MILPKLRTSTRIAKNDGLGALFGVAMAKLGFNGRVGSWIIPGKYAGFFLSYYERGVKEFVKKYKPEVFVTAGAWPCDYVSLAWDLGSRLVIGFEPDPNNYNYCTKFFEINRKKWKAYNGRGRVLATDGEHHAIVYNKALWSSSTTLRIRACRELANPGSKCVDGSGTLIHATRLDYLLSEPILGPRDRCLVLLDVEGSELEVLEGAKKLWDRCLFIIEVWRKNKSRYASYAELNRFKIKVLHKTPNGTEYWLLKKQ